MMSFFYDLKEKRLIKKGQKLLTKNDFEKANLLFQKAILINNSVENKFNLALSLLSLSEYSKAEKYLINIYNEFPENELNLLAMAECNIMQKKWDDAIKFYKLIVKLFPGKKNYEHYLDIAEDAVAREKYIKAKKLFKEATKNRYGKSFEALDNIKDIKAILSAPPSDLPVHYPRTSKEPTAAGENFRWFGKNKKPLEIASEDTKGFSL